MQCFPFLTLLYIVCSPYAYLLRNLHEFCEISKNTSFTEHLWTTASVNIYKQIRWKWGSVWVDKIFKLNNFKNS